MGGRREGGEAEGVGGGEKRGARGKCGVAEEGQRIWAGAGRGISPIHALDRVLGVTHLVEGDEGEAARLVRLAVLGEEDVRDVPELLEGPDKTKRESRLVSTSRPHALPPPLFALVVLLHVSAPAGEIRMCSISAWHAPTTMSMLNYRPRPQAPSSSYIPLEPWMVRWSL